MPARHPRVAQRVALNASRPRSTPSATSGERPEQNKHEKKARSVCADRRVTTSLCGSPLAAQMRSMAGTQERTHLRARAASATTDLQEQREQLQAGPEVGCQDLILKR